MKPKTSKLTKLALRGIKYLGDHGPVILTGLGIAGVVGTTLLAVKGTIKACEIVEKEKAERLDAAKSQCSLPGYESEGVDDKDVSPKPITKLEAIAMTWRYYVPAAVMGATTIACIVGSHKASVRKAAILSGLYQMSESQVEKLEGKMKEVIGDKQTGKVKEKITESILSDHPVNGAEIIETGSGNTLCYDVWSGRYFHSSIEAIRKAQNDFNHQLMLEFGLTLNELYGYMGLDSTGSGEEVGWTVNKPLEFFFTSKLASDGSPCLVVDFENRPTSEFRDY